MWLLEDKKMDTKEWNEKFISYRKVIKKLKNEINRDLKIVGLSMQHAPYLLLLENNEKLKIKELTKLSDNDPALTTRVLKTLSDKNLIARTCDNVRKCQIFLTKSGKEVVLYLNNLLKAMRNKIEKEMGGEDHEKFLIAMLN